MTDDDVVVNGSDATDSAPKLQREPGPNEAARRPLASLLAEAGVAPEEKLRLAVAEGMGSGERLGEIVLRRGWIDEAGLARLLARQWDLEYLDDEAVMVEPGASALLPRSDAERLGVCVIGQVQDRPRVAVAEPADERFEHVRSAVGRDCEFVVVTPATLERLLAQRASNDAEAEARATAAALRATEDTEADRLLSELDAGAGRLTEWGERVRRVVELQQQAENELADCRTEIRALQDELANERAKVGRLEEELAHQHELMNAAKAKLADVTRTLEAV